MLTDFETGRVEQDVAMSRMSGADGTDGYRAPEMSVAPRPSSGSDMYAYGVCLLRGCCAKDAAPAGQAWRQQLAATTQYRHLAALVVELLRELPNSVLVHASSRPSPDETQRIIDDAAAGARPSATTALAHPFLDAMAAMQDAERMAADVEAESRAARQRLESERAQQRAELRTREARVEAELRDVQARTHQGGHGPQGLQLTAHPFLVRRGARRKSARQVGSCESSRRRFSSGRTRPRPIAGGLTRGGARRTLRRPRPSARVRGPRWSSRGWIVAG